MKKNTFKKHERLCSRKLTSLVFDKGKSFTVYPFKVFYLPVDYLIGAPAQITFAISKRNFKRANRRNYIRRLCREAYRINKNILYSFLELQHLHLAMVFIYLSKDQPDSKSVEEKIILSLQRLIKENETNIGRNADLAHPVLPGSNFPL